MNEGVNKVVLLGNVGADPELRVTAGGKSVLKFSLATNEVWKDAEGNKRESTEWHRVVIWGARGDALSKFISMGQRLYVEGKNKTHSWEDESGKKLYATDVVADKVVFCGGGKDSRPEGGNQALSPRVGQGSRSPNRAPADVGDDDIPW